MAKQLVTLTSGTSWTAPPKASLLTVFLVGGGGGGGASGGGGGGSGHIALATYNVIPGTAVPYSIGGGGNGGPATLNGNGSTGGTTTFGSLLAYGGGPGTFLDGAGGGSSRNIYGTVTTTSGGSGGAGGGGGASPAGNGAGAVGQGAPGYFYEGTVYAGGGGGGCTTFTQNTTRPIYGGTGGAGGGGKGGGEGDAGTAGTAGLGGGGGGGARNGTYTARGTLTSYNNSPASPFLTRAAAAGGAGGSGVIVITYNEAEAVVIPNQSGVREGGTITFSVKTRNLLNNSPITYTLSGTGVTSSDFSPATLTGTVYNSSSDGGLTGTAVITITAATDIGLTEGNETVTLTLGASLGSTTFILGDLSQGDVVSPETTKISAAQYNTIYNKVASVIGPDGYNQTMLSSAASTSKKVSLSDWNKLKYDITNAWYHQLALTPSLVSVAISEKIKASVVTSPYTLYNTYADALVANKYTVHSSQASVKVAPASSPSTPWTKETSWPDSAGRTAWGTRIYSTIQVQWSTAARAKSFFDSGGEIRFIPTASTGSAEAQSLNWITFISGIGTAAFGANKPVTGAGSGGGNFYRLTNSFQAWYSSSSTNAYSSNEFKISARTPLIANNSLGNTNLVEFIVEWLDGHAALGSGTTDRVSGTFTITVNTLEPTGVLQPSGTGNFYVEQPSITIVPPSE